MPFTVAVFVSRKPELTPAEFQEAYDQYLPKMKGKNSSYTNNCSSYIDTFSDRW